MTIAAKSKMQKSEVQVLETRRPADGGLAGTVNIHSPARVAETAAALRAAQPAWQDLTVAQRTRWLTAFRDWILDNRENIADLIQRENGKVRSEAVLEVGFLCDIINAYARKAPALLADKHVRPTSPLMFGKRFTVVREPRPLVGVIGPWNVSLVLSLGDGIPALFAGSALMIKPSELTPLALHELIRGWREDVGAPPVLDAVYGSGETGSALVDTVDFVQFTGSVRTGQIVAKRAAAAGVPVSLELGGKDPMIVLSGANVVRAANCAVAGGFINNGQVCMSTERVYVEAPIYAEFVDRVLAGVEALRSGVDGPEIGNDVGAVTSESQIAIIEDHVADAVAKGATVLTGGARRTSPGSWYEPTVLVDVDHTMKIMTEETFGPVLPIMKVANETEAITLANDSPYGLAASIFASSVKEGQRIARKIDAGTININDWAVAAQCMDVPMGGWKASGTGSSRNGDDGLLKFTIQKTITAPRLPEGEREIWWPPYSPRSQTIIRRAHRLVNARGLARLGKPAFNALNKRAR